MESFELFLRARVEPATYIVFFGMLAVFGWLETRAGRSHRPPRRAGRWPTNTGLTVLNIAVLGAVPVSGVAFADRMRDAGIGLFHLVDAGPFAALAGGFLVRSFTSWATHLAMHKTPFLWRFHRVHHSDTFLDVSTTARFHPAELLINMPIMLMAVALFGIPPVALMLYEVFDAGMNVFTHANVRLPARLDRALGVLIVTPDMHRVHHSSCHRETDSNYGATLSIWDHLFRTYGRKDGPALAEMEIGLREVQDRRANSLPWLLSLPFAPIRIPRRARGPEPGAKPSDEEVA